MSGALDVLALAAFAAMWVYCERHRIDPIEAATELVQWIQGAITRRHS